jgi:hypothetical protein
MDPELFGNQNDSNNTQGQSGGPRSADSIDKEMGPGQHFLMEKLDTTKRFVRQCVQTSLPCMACSVLALSSTQQKAFTNDAV